MLKGIWCTFLKSLDAMETELHCLCGRRKSKEKNCHCEKKESCFSLDAFSFEKESCRCDQHKEKC